MNVFLSWSGDRSKAVTELLDDWMQCVIQAVDPWMSSKDIDRGSLWFSEISDQLQNTSIGIICLTQENKNKPWILFEAGALAKGLTNSRVCTFLIDLEPTDVGSPLSQFNHTLPTKDGLWELVRTLNNTLKEKALKERTLQQVFETYWPQFQSKFALILAEYPVSGPVEKRSEDDILLEILSSTRAMSKRISSLENTTNGASINLTKPRKHSFKNINLSSLLDDEITTLLEEGMPKELIPSAIAGDVGISESQVKRHMDVMGYEVGA